MRYKLIFALLACLVGQQALAAWSFVGAGTAAISTTDDQTLNGDDGLTLPSHSEGDVLLVCWHADTQDDETADQVTPSGYTQLAYAVDTQSDVETGLYGKVAGASESVPDLSLDEVPSGSSIMSAQIAAFSGGTITVHNSDTNFSNDGVALIQIPALTVTEDNSLIIVCAGAFRYM